MAPPAPRVDVKAITAVFEKYADDGEDWITMGGISNLATDCGLDAETDVSALVMAWKLKSCARPGEISKEEFVAGMSEMRIDSVTQLKDMVPSFDVGFMEHKEFQEFFRFCFKFNREDVQKKTLEKDLVIQLLPMLLGGRSPYTDKFCAFLHESAAVSRISADEWNSFILFSKEFEAGSVEAFEDDGAWPTLIDDFVEYLRK